MLEYKKGNTRSYNTSLIYKISPLRFQNPEDIESNHQLEKSDITMDFEKLYIQHQKNSIR